MLILLVRFARQTKQAPEEPQYRQLELQKSELEKKIQTQNQEIIELNLKIAQLGEASPPTENQGAEASSASEPTATEATNQPEQA